LGTNTFISNDSIPNFKTQKKKKKKGTKPATTIAFNRLWNLIVKKQARKKERRKVVKQKLCN
jgi:hypothetical protein